MIHASTHGTRRTSAGRAFATVLLAGLAVLAAPAVPHVPVATVAAQDAAARTVPTPDEARQALEVALVPAVRLVGEDPSGRASLAHRMEALGVPAVSVAVVVDGRLHWADAWGMADVAEGRPATPETRFQAASISKPLAALAALRMIDAGRLVLDAPVERYLESWRVPASEAAEGRPVTLRQLMTHTAGLTVSGFPGYAADAPVPSTVEVLDGAGPANTAPVRVDQVPGSRWRYSGGGYTVLQLLLSDVAGRPFPALMRETVLGPLGMDASTYEQPLPDSLRDEAATAYRVGPVAIEGRWHTYPEMAAAGLWTTPTDLARWVVEVQRAIRGESELLSADLARAMIRPDLNRWGLGPSMEGEGPALRFSHGGSNEGYRAYVFGAVDGSHGAAVMTNGDTGNALVSDVVRTLAEIYGWPGWSPEVVDEVPLNDEQVSALEGAWDVEGMGIAVRVEDAGDGRVRVVIPGRPVLRLVHAGDDVFVSLEDGSRLQVERDDDGTPVALTFQGVRAVKRAGG